MPYANSDGPGSEGPGRPPYLLYSFENSEGPDRLLYLPIFVDIFSIKQYFYMIQ